MFFAAGVFYYFRTEQVRALCAAMAERFPGGRLVFDAAGPTAVKLMLKTWVKQGRHPGCGGVFFGAGPGQGAVPVDRPDRRLQPGLYAGLPETPGPGHPAPPPPAGTAGRRAAETADCADRVPSQKRGVFPMNEPFIFRVRDCYYIRASYPSPAEHRHFAAHLVFALERPFTALVDGKSVETVGIAIGSDVPHTIQSVDPALVVFIDELTPMSRCVKHTLLQGAPWRALDASVSSGVGKRWGEVRTETDAATAAAETERLLGLQAEHAPAEDPRGAGGRSLHEIGPPLWSNLPFGCGPGRSPVSQPPDSPVPAGYRKSPSLYLANLKLERAFYLLDTGTISHPGLHGRGLCHPVPYGGYQPEAVRHVHDRGEADLPDRPGSEQQMNRSKSDKFLLQCPYLTTRKGHCDVCTDFSHRDLSLQRPSAL